jgi:hypothetical protein
MGLRPSQGLEMLVEHIVTAADFRSSVLPPNQPFILNPAVRYD